MADQEIKFRPVLKRTLPVALEPRTDRPSLVRTETGAAFVSHLLAARSRLENQRDRRRAPLNAAVDAYAAGATIAVRRIPQGYRKTLVV